MHAPQHFGAEVCMTSPMVAPTVTTIDGSMPAHSGAELELPAPPVM